MSIVEACARIETNDSNYYNPTTINIWRDMSNDQTVPSLMVEFNGSYYMEADEYRDYTFDKVDVWTRLGKAIQGLSWRISTFM